MSHKSQGYQQSAAMAAGLDSQLDGMADKPATKLGNNNTVAVGATEKSATAIPGYYHTADSHEDTRIAYKASAAGVSAPNLGISAQSSPYSLQPDRGPGFQVSLTDKDIDYLEKRRQENLQAEFDDWVTHAINLEDPGEARWLQQMYPEFWARREKYLDDKINVEARAAKLKLRGIKDQSDLKFLFAIQRGYIQLPSTPAFAQGQTEYVKGWFRRVGDANARGTRPDAYAPAAFTPGPGPVAYDPTNYWKPNAADRRGV